MSKLSDKVIQEISEKKIAPIPKWRFLLKDWFIWSVSVVSVLLGSVSVAIALHQMTTNDNMPVTRLTDVFTFVPYFWVMVLALFTYTAFHNFHHTEEGYKYKTATILGIAISVSVIIGTMLALIGLGGRMNAYLASNVPYYSQYADMRSYVWMNPAEGRIAGKIMHTTPNQVMVIKDLNGKLWNVTYNDAIIGPAVILRRGYMVKIVGEVTGDGDFMATEIRPWTGMGGRMQGNVKGMRTIR